LNISSAYAILTIMKSREYESRRKGEFYEKK